MENVNVKIDVNIKTNAENPEDPFNSDAPAGTQKPKEDNVCISCEG